MLPKYVAEVVAIPWLGVLIYSGFTAILSVFCLFGVSSFRGIFQANSSHTYEVSGKFFGYNQHSYKSPYLIKLDSGKVLSFGCYPNSRIIQCLERDSGFDRNVLYGKRVTISYRKYFDIRPEYRSNIIYSLILDNLEILSHSERSAQVESKLKSDEMTFDGYELSYLILAVVLLFSLMSIIAVKIIFSWVGVYNV